MREKYLALIFAAILIGAGMMIPANAAGEEPAVQSEIEPWIELPLQFEIELLWFLLEFGLGTVTIAIFEEWFLFGIGTEGMAIDIGFLPIAIISPYILAFLSYIPIISPYMPAIAWLVNVILIPAIAWLIDIVLWLVFPEFRLDSAWFALGVLGAEFAFQMSKFHVGMGINRVLSLIEWVLSAVGLIPGIGGVLGFIVEFFFTLLDLALDLIRVFEKFRFGIFSGLPLEENYFYVQTGDLLMSQLLFLIIYPVTSIIVSAICAAIRSALPVIGWLITLFVSPILFYGIILFWYFIFSLINISFDNFLFSVDIEGLTFAFEYKWALLFWLITIPIYFLFDIDSESLTFACGHSFRLLIGLITMPTDAVFSIDAEGLAFSSEQSLRFLDFIIPLYEVDFEREWPW